MTSSPSFDPASTFFVVTDTNPSTQVYSVATSSFVLNSATAYTDWLLFFYAIAQNISGMADNGSGLIRLTVGATNQFLTGQRWRVEEQVGQAAATGTWQITVIDSTHIDLVGSSFNSGDPWVSGGLIKGAQIAPNVAAIQSMVYTGPVKKTGDVMTGQLVIGHTTQTFSGSGLEVTGIVTTNASINQTLWNATPANSAVLSINRSKGAAIGTFAAVALNDVLGVLNFRGSSASAFVDGANITGIALGAPSGSKTPSLVRINTYDTAGTGVLAGEFGPSGSKLWGTINATGASPGYVGQILEAAAANGSLVVGTPVAITSIAVPPGDWDVWGGFLFSGLPQSASCWASIGTVANATDNNPLRSSTNYSISSGWAGMTVGPFKVQIATTTTYYGNALIVAGGAGGCSVAMYARRRS